MLIHVLFGWYIIPLLITVGTTFWVRSRNTGGGYAGAITETVLLLLWLITNLFVWLVYAACAAIFNIF